MSTDDTPIIWPHLNPQAIEISTMKEVKASFMPGYDPEINWLFVGTTNLYGLKLNLDIIEEIVNDESDFSDSINGKYPVNVLIVHPRIAVIKYGDVMVGQDDIEWMRGIVRQTLEAINASQEQNV